MIREPWAQDAVGRSIATSLSVTGSTLTMAVEHDPTRAAYPVTTAMEMSSADAVDQADVAQADAASATWDEQDEADYDATARPFDETGGAAARQRVH